MTAARLEVTRLAALYCLPRGLASPGGAKSRLDQALERALPRVLATLLAPMARHHQGVVLIRRLEVNLTLDVGLDPETLATRWAQSFARRLFRALAGQTDQVMTYPDRPAQLARFVLDLARGEAWERWYHAPFEGVRAMPPKMGIRTVLAQDPEMGRAALRQLSPSERIQVARRLDAPEVRRLLATLAPTLDPAALADAEGQALEHLATAAAPRIALPVAPVALLTFLELLDAGVPTVAAASAARLVLAVRTAALDLAILRHALDGRATALRRLPPGLAARLAPAMARAPSVRQALAETLAGSARLDPPPRQHTPFGGLLMLLPIADALLPVAGGEVRLLALAACAGPDRAPRVVGDPVLRHLLALPARRKDPPLDPEFILGGLMGDPDRSLTACPAVGLPAELAPGADGALTCAALRILGHFAFRLPGFGGSSADFLWANFLDVSARVDRGEDRVEITLARPPIAVILAMTRLPTAVFSPRGWSGPPLRLRLER